MTNVSHVEKVELQGSEIQQMIYSKLGPAVEGERMDLAILSMLTFAILLMKPNITPEQLRTAVMGTSEYLMLALTDTEELGEVN